MTTCYASPVSGQNDNNLIQFIASTVEHLRQRVDTMSEQMATKVDLANLRDEMFATMATKEDLARLEASMDERFAGVDDRFTGIEDRFTGIETRLARVESSLDAKTTAIRGDIEQVHLRLDSIDRGLNNRIGHVETDVSRIRSVVYLLVKDKPEMLRLLGGPNPGELDRKAKSQSSRIALTLLHCSPINRFCFFNHPLKTKTSQLLPA